MNNPTSSIAKNLFRLLIAAVFFSSCGCSNSSGKINRRAIVDRNSPSTSSFSDTSPAQVGNGEFAFSADITGLQTFAAFNTMSHWGWHSMPLPKGSNLADFKGTNIDCGGRKVNYCIADDSDSTQKTLGAYLAANPHRMNLGRIGFDIKKRGGSPAKAEDLKKTFQKLDLWSGILQSKFEIDGVPVEVETSCHPGKDAISVRAKSELFKDASIRVFIEFPYGDEKYYSQYVGNFGAPEKHSTRMEKTGESCILLTRDVDDLHYRVGIKNCRSAVFSADENKKHKFYISSGGEDKLEFVCEFSKGEIDPKKMPSAAEVAEASAEAWKNFWMSGAAVDFSQSADSRWKELERRVVLSQYIMRVNAAGSLPPQESGLVCNTWHGRLHFEMIFSHLYHYALWDRWELALPALSIYEKFLPTSLERAKRQGYSGARWPKCTADFDREWPHPIHATLIWQQPHPIYFAETDYRLNPSKETLEKWKNIVFATADFIADLPLEDKKTGMFNLEPPLFIVSENTDFRKTRNPAFELSYWRYALRTALEWQKRLGIPENEKWQKVLSNLAPLPVQNGTYATHQGIENMWTKFNFEHPALIGVFGLLPGDGVDRQIFLNTINKVKQTWNFDRTWGWDFPMLAMAAARSGDSKSAVDFLLHPSKGFQFDAHGLATGGPFPYMPSNGSLLAAVAMMAHQNLFPPEWNVKSEGFNPHQ